MTPCESCREKDEVIARLNEQVDRIKDKYGRIIDSWEEDQMGSKVVLEKYLSAKAQLVAQAETIKAMREAIGVFFHHWEHGGISRDNIFHQQTAYVLRQALALPSKPSPDPLKEQPVYLTAEVERLKDAVVEAARKAMDEECPSRHLEAEDALNDAIAALDAAAVRKHDEA